MSGPLQTGSNRWDQAASRTSGAAYDTRFKVRAARGMSVHGEATFCANLLSPGAMVLDAGCGTGRVAKRLQELGFSCAGVDADASMLAQARSATAVQWLLADLADSAAMSVFAARFDLVLAAGNVIPLLAPGTEAAVIATLAGALMPGGLFVAGFGLDAAHLPLAAPPFGLQDYDAWCAAAGLTLIDRHPGWDTDIGAPAGYAVSVHRLA